MSQLLQKRWLLVVLAVLLLALFTFLTFDILSNVTAVKSTPGNTRQSGSTPLTVQSPTSPTNTPQATMPSTPTPTPHPNLPVKLSIDPYSNSAGQHRTEVEPSSYSYGNTIVDTFQAGRFLDVGSSNIGWATSTDGGTTWQNGFLQGTTKLMGGPYDRITDPSVTYDARHNTWMIATVVFLANSSGIVAPAVLVSLSTNGGTAWNNPITIANTGNGLDKDWITCDNTLNSPYFGNCYAQWDDYTKGDLIELSTSRDGGRTWGAIKTTAAANTGTSGYPLVQANGTVIVPISNAHETEIMVFRSTDGGASWSRAVPLTSVTSFSGNAYFTDNILLTPQVDQSGKVYLVWVDCRFETNCQGNDLVMMTSTDGISWSLVQRIPIAPRGSGVNYYVSGFGIDPTTSGASAHLGLTFYYYPADCFNNCSLSVGFVSSIDGGSTWSSKIRLGGPIPGSWIAQGNNKVGDYIATAFCNGRAFPIFALATAPSGGYFNEAMYTIQGGIGVGSS